MGAREKGMTNTQVQLQLMKIRTHITSKVDKATAQDVADVIHQLIVLVESLPEKKT